eukprot:TRINITY_DN1630_c0_g1_i1.p1 TRINITY_DN1630_c0_g1~~TRINITY_DN1630_c0_g1_i1.p1  ORF type:complete len:200 (-),score=16.62 TRINITY_DN1630_c0_g1_i1:29-628(-)
MAARVVPRRRPNLSINALRCTLPVQRVGEAEPTTEGTPHECATEIIPGLFLGAHNDALNFERLRANNIKYIINVTRECDSPDAAEQGFEYIKFPVDDHSDANIAVHFHEAIRWIDRARQENKGVLVHCYRGISRSATIVIAYLIARLGMSFHDSFELVKRKRDIISPNLGFVLALENFQSLLRPPTPVAPVSTPRELEA